MSQPTSRGGARLGVPRSEPTQRLPPSLPAGGAWDSRQQERQQSTTHRTDQRAWVGSSDGHGGDGPVRSTLPRSVTPQRLPAGGEESRQQDGQRWIGPSEGHSSEAVSRSDRDRSTTPQRSLVDSMGSRQQDTLSLAHNRNPGDVSRRRLGAPASAPSHRTQRSRDKPADHDGGGEGLLAAQRRLNQVLLDRLDLYVLAALRSSGPRWPYSSPS